MAETRQKLFDMFPPVSPEEWRAKAEVDLKGADFGKKMVWRTNEGFDVQPLYRGVDIENLKATESLPGEYPFVRGTRTNNDWLSRQDIVVEDVAEANAKALDVLNKGIDSLGFKVNGEVKLADLLKGIYLPACEINIMCCPKCALAYATELVELVKAAGCEETFKGSIDFDPFKRQFKHGVAFPGDIKAMATELLNAVKDIKGLKVLSVNTKNLTNAGAYIYQELGYALSWGNEWMAMMTEAGFSADEVAHRIKFNMGVSTIYFMEIAKFRAARMLWAKLVSQFNPKNPKSLALRTHCQTSGWSLTEQDPFNNVGRTCIEAMAAALGHTQSLHTNALDEAIALPTDFSARIARNTQIYLQEETNICRVVDPWAGSYYVETLTHEIANRAWAHIQEIEALGGMAKAIESGVPKMRIEEASARKQSRIDSNVDTIVGINKYRLDHEDPIETLEVDNTAVRKAQIERLAKLRAERNNEEVQAALDALTECAKSGKGNLLELSIDAARKRASLGEISYALEKVYGRYKAKINLISNVYSTQTKDSDSFKKAQALTDEFAKLEGRRPRIMVAKMGQDGHDRGAKVVATGYADLGFDVDMGPLFQTPAEAAKQAVENDVHVLGVSSLAAGHKTLVPQVIEELKKLGREDIMVVVGGVIPPQDYEFLFESGAACIFGPGTVISESAIKMMNILLEARK